MQEFSLVRSFSVYNFPFPLICKFQMEGVWNPLPPKKNDSMYVKMKLSAVASYFGFGAALFGIILTSIVASSASTMS